MPRVDDPNPHADSIPCRLHPVVLSERLVALGADLGCAAEGRRPFLVTERKLARLLRPLVAELEGIFPGLEVVTFAGGERNKTRAVKGRIEDALMAAGAGRDSLLVALGGGVVTDVVGFAAGTYMRGVPWVAVPTSLVGMVDAALGGKTGVDTPLGKNLVGLFHPPSLVAVPLDALGRLPLRQFRAGLAECLKHGLVLDEAHFHRVASIDPGTFRRQPAGLRALVMESATLKCAVVDRDPREATGHRNALNAGHTVGHALERLSGFRLVHGEAVAAGLCWEAASAAAEGRMERRDADAVRAAVERLGFPPLWRGAAPEAVMDAARWDKKNRSGAVAYVPPAGLGRMALPPPHTAELTGGVLAEGHRILEGA